MKIGLVSDCLGSQSFDELLDSCVKLGIEQVELGVGNWSSAPHVDLDGLLESETKRDEMKGKLKDHGLSISAFNCSGNPLAPGDWGKREDEVTRKCFKLSEYFGLDKVENFEKLRDACGGDKTIGFNLDPSHLFWMGADPIAVARALGDAIYHVHVKDVRIEKSAATNTLLDGKHVLEFAKRSWNFAIPGYGHDERWWREFLVTLKMMGYDGVLSIEHEDYTMDTLSALGKSVKLLKENIPY